MQATASLDVSLQEAIATIVRSTINGLTYSARRWPPAVGVPKTDNSPRRFLGTRSPLTLSRFRARSQFDIKGFRNLEKRHN
jgi:hypothetical protein